MARQHKHAVRSIVDAESGFTFLQQRLRYVDSHPSRAFVNIAENVPVWPTPFVEAALHSDDLLQYGPCEGASHLLQAIARREHAVNHLAPAPDQICVTNGALHGISLVVRDRARPGAVALVQAPAYTCVPAMLRAVGFEVRYFRLASDGDVDALGAMLGDDTGLVYINSPHNPTGHVLDRATTARIVALTAARGVTLLADVVYDSFVTPGADRGTPLADPAAWSHVYTVNSMSKNYGAPGLRIGWVLSSAANINALSALLERECVCISGASQRLAAAILDQGNAALVAHVEEGRKLVEEGVRKLPRVTCTMGAGGTQAFAALPVDDIEAYGDTVLRELGLLLATRSQYDGVDGPYIRLPYGAPRAALARAFTLLSESLAVYGSADPRS